jgi:hypothetical protein
MPFSSTPVYVGRGDLVELRYPTPSTWNTQQTVQVQIGTGTDPDGVTFGTRIPDSRPDNFSFNDQQGSTNPLASSSGDFVTTFQKTNTYYSNEILVNGIEIEIPAVVSCTTTGPKGNTTGQNASAAFRINRNGTIGPWITSGTVRQGDRIRLRVTTENWYTTVSNVTLTLSDQTWGTNIGQPSTVVSDTWSITTRAQDQTVNQYTFIHFVDVRASEFNGFKTFNIPITGIDNDVVLRASSTGNGQISKDNVNWGTSVTGLKLNDILYSRISIGNAYTSTRSSVITVFAQAGDTLTGGFENNSAGTYGTGVFAVTQTLGSVNDTWRLWTEVDRYPELISLSPIYTKSDDRIDQLPGSTETIDNVVVSSTTTFNAAEPGFTYLADFNISGLGIEFVSGAYNTLRLSSSSPTFTSTPNTSSVNGSDVEILCTISSGAGEIRKNNSGNWVQQLYVKNGDQVNFRFTASTSFNTTLTSTVTLVGPPAGGPLGNPTAGPNPPTFANKESTITLKTRLARSTPYPFRAKDIFDANPGSTYIITVPIAGLDVNTTAQIVDSLSTAGTNAQLSVNNITYGKTITVTPDTPFIYLRATAPSAGNALANIVYQVGTYQDTFKIYTKVASNIYASYDGSGADNFIEFNLPSHAESVNFVLIGGGGGTGGDDAPNSFGGRGGFSNIIRGTINLPPNVLGDENLRRIKIFSGDSGKFGQSYLGGALGGEGGFGYATGGRGGNAGPSDRSGAGGGGGGASAITLGDGTLIAFAGGGAGGGGAGNDTTLPEPRQNGNNDGFGELKTTLSGLNFSGPNGQDNTLRGGGGGGAGGGYGSAGTINTQKLDESGNIIQISDLDGNGGTGGGAYYNTSYVTLAQSNGFSNFGSGSSEAGFVLINYPPQDITPNPFVFTQIDGATPGQQYESEKVTITGITGTVIVTVSGNNSQVRTCDSNGSNCTSYSTSTTVRNGQQIQVRATAGPNFFTSYSTVVRVGNVDGFFIITTGEPPDTDPLPFTIPSKLNQSINTLVESDIVTISGINVPVSITASNGAEISICTGGICDPFASSPRTITNGQSFKLRITSSPDYSTTVQSTVTVGTGSSATWDVRTINEPDLTPVSFVFTDLFNQDLNKEVLSDPRTIQGIDSIILMTVTGGASVILNGDNNNLYEPVNGVTTVPVENFDIIQLAYTTSDIVGDVKEFVITVGTYSTVWTVANVGVLGTSPNPFSFAPVFSSGPNQFGESLETVTIAGLQQPVSVYATNKGQISINGGPYQQYTAALPGTVTNGNTIRVRLRSSEITGFSISTNIVVGSFSTLFTVTTPANITDDIFGQWYSSPNVVKVIGSSQLKFNTKFDGLPVGTIMPVFKDNTQSDGWGVDDDKLNGKADSRFPGWVYCDGRFVSPTDYPLLYSVIGNTYGGNIAGEFRLPDFRNRKVLGTGSIDGSSPSSPVVTPEYGPNKVKGAGAADRPGSFGGMWFIDQIGDPGVDELEQVISPGAGLPAQESQFFAIAQISTTGYERVRESIEFFTSGQVSGNVSLKETKIFDVPFHQHLLVTGQADPGNFKGRVSWGSFGGAPGNVNIGQKTGNDAFPPLEGTVGINLWGYATASSYTLASGPGGGGDGIRTTNSSSYGPVWARRIGIYGNCAESRYRGNFLDPNIQPGPNESTVECLFNFVFTADCGGPPTTAQIWNTITIQQPNSALFGEIYNYINQNALPSDTISGENLRWIGAVTIPRRFISIQKFSPLDKKSHSHYLSLSAITDVVNRFSYGNSNGPGTAFTNTPSTASVNVTFNAAQVGLEMFPGSFVLSNSKQLIPTPSFAPQEKVPLVTPYTQVRWMVKAY